MLCTNYIIIIIIIVIFIHSESAHAQALASYVGLVTEFGAEQHGGPRFST